MQRFMQDVQKGTFDFVLTKPVDAQFMASTRQFQLWKLIDVVLGLAIIGWALWRNAGANHHLARLSWLRCCSASAWSLFTVLDDFGTMAFWMIRVDNMFQIFNAMFVAGRWPVNIYPTGLRAVLTFVVPIAFAVTVPAEALIGRITPTTFALSLWRRHWLVRCRSAALLALRHSQLFRRVCVIEFVECYQPAYLAVIDPFDSGYMLSAE